VERPRPRRLGRANDGDVRVQLRVERVDPRQIEVDELLRRDVTAPDELRLLERRQEREVAQVESP
jgi:hypothetical protein